MIVPGIVKQIPVSLAGFVRVWFISLHVQAVMPVVSAKQPDIFPHACMSIILVSYRASHIFKHLQNSEHCCALCSVDCFHILDHASTSFQLKIKEAIIHIQIEQPSLNQQLHHFNLKLSF